MEMHKYIRDYQPAFEPNIHLYTVDQIPGSGSKIYILLFYTNYFLNTEMITLFPYDVDTRENFIKKMYCPTDSKEKRTTFWIPRKEEKEARGVNIPCFGAEEIFLGDKNQNLYLYFLCKTKFFKGDRRIFNNIAWYIDIICFGTSHEDRKDFYISSKYFDYLEDRRNNFLKDKKVFFIREDGHKLLNSLVKYDSLEREV